VLKAGVKRRTEVETHDSAPRVAGPGSHPNRQALRAHSLLEQFASRPHSSGIGAFLVDGRFTLRGSFRFEMVRIPEKRRDGGNRHGATEVR
jgi:hypothetical protein